MRVGALDMVAETSGWRSDLRDQHSSLFPALTSPDAPPSDPSPPTGLPVCGAGIHVEPELTALPHSSQALTHSPLLLAALLHLALGELLGLKCGFFWKRSGAPDTAPSIRGCLGQGGLRGSKRGHSRSSQTEALTPRLPTPF